MQFKETPLAGAFVIETEPHEDNRGFFARTFCAGEFEAKGLVGIFVQCSISWNTRRGTVRGMHYQLPPSCEAKLVRCTAGALWDVIVDLREESSTHMQFFGIELSARNRTCLVYSRNVRARISDSRGRYRGFLPDERVLCAGSFRRPALRRSETRHRMALASRRDRGQGSHLGIAANLNVKVDRREFRTVDRTDCARSPKVSHIWPGISRLSDPSDLDSFWTLNYWPKPPF